MSDVQNPKVTLAAAATARDLIQLERTLMEAVRLAAKLPADLMARLQDVGASPVEGQAAMDALVETLTRANDARRKVPQAHQRLRELAKRLGADPKSYGDQFDCDDFVFMPFIGARAAESFRDSVPA